MSIIQDIQKLLRQKNNGLYWLIFINTVLFLLVNVLSAVGALGGIWAFGWVDALCLPSSLEVAMHQPWSFLTYMFVHKELLHFAFNMLWLYWLGALLENRIGTRKFVQIYVWGGFAGGLLYLVLESLALQHEVLHYLLGASAGVMAVVIATAFFMPDLVLNLFLIGPVQLKYVALGSFILTSLLDLSNNTGGKIAHIGGAMVGVLSFFLYKNDWWPLFKGRSSPLKVAHRRPLSDEDFNAKKVEIEQRTDAILDKISRSGYDSLTREEKEFLFKQSKQ